MTRFLYIFFIYVCVYIYIYIHTHIYMSIMADIHEAVAERSAVIAGYFNLVLNPGMDSYNYKHVNNPDARDQECVSRRCL